MGRWLHRLSPSSKGSSLRSRSSSSSQLVGTEQRLDWLEHLLVLLGLLELLVEALGHPLELLVVVASYLLEALVVPFGLLGLAYHQSLALVVR